jgi:hypothetical protein
VSITERLLNKKKLMLNTPKKSNPNINNNDKPFTDQNPLEKANICIASTE